MLKINFSKKDVWPGAAAIASAYFSIIAAVGIILGYVATRWFMRKYYDTGRLKSIVFYFGNWRIHLHHWVVGTLVLVAIPIIGSYHECPKILLGLVGGVIAEDFEDAYRPVVGWIRGKK
jgi:hypothetical protein